MGNIRHAMDVNHPKKTSKEESTYRQGLARILRKLDDGFDSFDRMENALDFFDPEWDARDQKFIRKFAMWAKSAQSPTTEDLLAVAKFGVNTDRAVSVATIANNLRIPFTEALFRCVSLAALGLAERVATSKPGRKFDVLFSPPALTRFSLGVLALATFSDEQVAHLALFFRPEIEGKRDRYAVNLIESAVEAKEEFESHPIDGADINLIAHGVLFTLSQHHRPQPVGHLAQELHLPAGVVSFAVLLNASSGQPVLREGPFWSDRSKVSLLKVSLGETEDIGVDPLSKEDAQRMFAIANAGNLGSMPKEEAKAIFEHAANTTPLSDDPALPEPSPRCPECRTPMVTYENYSMAWVCPQCRALDEGDEDGCEVHAPAIDGYCPDCGHPVDDDDEEQRAWLQPHRTKPEGIADRLRLDALILRMDAIEDDTQEAFLRIENIEDELRVLVAKVEGHLMTPNAHTKRELERAAERAKKTLEQEDEDDLSG